MVAPSSKFYTVSTMLFHKYGGANVAIKNCICHTFLCFLPTKATVKLANNNTGHLQEIEIILCRFPNCTIIYTVVPVYHCTSHPSNTISSGALKFLRVFKRLHLNVLNIATFLALNVVLGDHPTRLKTI